MQNLKSGITVESLQSKSIEVSHLCSAGGVIEVRKRLFDKINNRA